MNKIPTYKVKLVRDNRAPLNSGALLPELAEKMLQRLTADIPHEEVWALMVDGKTHFIGAVRIGQGGKHGAALMAADILRPMIAHNAAAFILGHNHPSGDPTPSQEDITLTKDLAEIAHKLGVPLLDHIVVTSKRCVSMHALGLVP